MIFLFDVDGTLTAPQKKIGKKTVDLLMKIRDRVAIGFVSGSDIAKIEKQIPVDIFDFGFPENGNLFYQNTRICREGRCICELNVCKREDCSMHGKTEMMEKNLKDVKRTEESSNNTNSTADSETSQNTARDLSTENTAVELPDIDEEIILPDPSIEKPVDLPENKSGVVDLPYDCAKNAIRLPSKSIYNSHIYGREKEKSDPIRKTHHIMMLEAMKSTDDRLVLVNETRLVDTIGEEGLKKLVNKILEIFSETDCFVKRGNFIEIRNSMLNISLIGRGCSNAERKRYVEYDRKTNGRKKIIEKLSPTLENLKMDSSIGGEISIDIYPRGFNKTRALDHLDGKEIYFFGDKTDIGGNDYEIYMSKKCNSKSVNGPEDCIRKIEKTLKDIACRSMHHSEEILAVNK